MRLITGLFAASIAIGIAAPAQALPNHIEHKGVTYVTNPGAPRVSALVTATGAPVWVTQLAQFTIPSPDLTLSLALEHDVLYVTGYSIAAATDTGFVWAVDAVTGQVLWLTTLAGGGGIYSAATVDKDVLYVAGGGPGAPSRTSALNAVTGEVLWQAVTTFPVFSSPTIAKDGVVLTTGGFPGSVTLLIVLDPATGAPLLTSPVP